MERNKIVKLVFNVSTPSPPLQMLIINYLLLTIYFLTQVAVFAAPLPAGSALSPQSDNGSGMHSGSLSGRQPPEPKCHYCKTSGAICKSAPGEACERCKGGGVVEWCSRWNREESVSLSLWRPLFSIATRGMT